MRYFAASCTVTVLRRQTVVHARAFGALLICGAIAAACVFLADRPGTSVAYCPWHMQFSEPLFTYIAYDTFNFPFLSD
jgi:hypothetical protein